MTEEKAFMRDNGSELLKKAIATFGEPTDSYDETEYVALCMMEIFNAETTYLPLDINTDILFQLCIEYASDRGYKGITE